MASNLLIGQIGKQACMDKLIIAYYKGLIGNFYKILPLYEGRDLKTKQIVYLPDIAYQNFQNYVSNLLVEVYGSSNLFFVNEYSIKIVSILQGILHKVEIDKHKKLKTLVFQCVSLCEKIIVELEGRNNGL
jgi:hypothetical protein